jgi:hypothetical protein
MYADCACWAIDSGRWRSGAGSRPEKLQGGEVVADELIATAGEDGRAPNQTRPLLLAATGGGPSDAPPVWKHAATDRAIAAAGAVERAGAEDNLAKKVGCDLEVSAESVPKAGVLGSGVLWKEWNWPSRSLMGAFRIKRSTSTAPAQAAGGRLMLPERPKRRFWFSPKGAAVSQHQYF